MKKKTTHPASSRFTTVEIHAAACTGCNTCVDICIMDVLAPNPEKGKPPIVAYPDECWFDGCCVDMCPQQHKGAIKINTPLPMKVSVLRGERIASASQDNGQTEEP
jgi:NAD-dependent dihydropyrimidine dehydrogenase PreA subunit